MAKIRVIRLRVAEAPEVVFIDDGTLQEEVGGYIDVVPMAEGVDAFVNDEGILDGLPFNRVLPTSRGGVPVVGDVVLAGHDGEGETISLTDAQIAHWLPKLLSASQQPPPHDHHPLMYLH